MTQSHALKAPGATLYYEVRGRGPVLLMIPGGPADAGVFDGLAEALSDRFTVVAYDPRGNSRSTCDAPPAEQDVDLHGDDAAAVLAKVADGAALVFGSSGGAQIGLNLAARHPDRVRALVAHEPPCIPLLPDAEAILARTEEIHQVFLREGLFPALQAFGELSGLGGGPPPPPSPATARINGNLDYFIRHGIRPLSGYRPDVAALKNGPVRVIVGVGADSEGQLAHRTAVALAEALGQTPTVFPGGHGGFGEHAQVFAETLDRVLQQTPATAG